MGPKKIQTKHFITFVLLLWSNMKNIETTGENTEAIRSERPLLEDILYFGWFLNETSASSLQNLTEDFFEQIRNEIPEFSNFLERITSDSNSSIYLNDYFTKPVDPVTAQYDPLYHITAKYCGSGANCTDYYSRFTNYVGLHFSTSIVGLFITKRTFGARVNLSCLQQRLFDEEIEKIYEKKNNRRIRDVLDASVFYNGTNEKYPGLIFYEQPPNFSPTVSRAHVTLATAPNVPAVTTGPDLIEVIEYEKVLSSNCKNLSYFSDLTNMSYDDYNVSKFGVVRHFYSNLEDDDDENTAFVLYADFKIIFQTEYKIFLNRSVSIVFKFSTILQLVSLLAYLYLPKIHI